MLFRILADFGKPILTTFVFFSLSALLSLCLAVVFCFASRAETALVRCTAHVLIEVSRGVPTVVFILLMGNLGMSPVFGFFETLGSLPGTPSGFTAMAIFVFLGLAFSSAGHMSKIIDAGLSTINQNLLDYLFTLKYTWVSLTWLLFVEAMPALIQPLFARLTHHLHNTAFISLFPITGIFAAMRKGVDETALVGLYVSVATILFVLIGEAISILGRMIQNFSSRAVIVDR